MAAELGLGGEYVPIISHAIREQLYKHKRQLVDDVSMHSTFYALPILIIYTN
jgi:hypothetical protein